MRGFINKEKIITIGVNNFLIGRYNGDTTRSGVCRIISNQTFISVSVINDITILTKDSRLSDIP